MCCSDLALTYAAAHSSWGQAKTVAATDHAAFVRLDQDGVGHARLAVDGVHCASCMAAIERSLAVAPGVIAARLNFSDRRLDVSWRPGETDLEAIVRRLDDLGFKAQPFDRRNLDASESQTSRSLVRAIAVSGFASMNIMLLAVSVWAGNVSDMTPETRDLFHWLQAAIALPAVAYAGRTFFDGAIAGVRARRLTMDFPIALGVVLTLAMSVVETLRSAEHAYFDSATMLLFFLLVGRALEQAMRQRTRVLAANLSALRRDTAARFEPDGSIREIPSRDVAFGDRILVRPGERIAADGEVEAGSSDIDCSPVTGEIRPIPAAAGTIVRAGSLNGGGALTVRATAGAGRSFLDEIEALIGRALEERSRTVLIADLAARLYIPVVHVAALLTAGGWLIVGGDFHAALLNAVAVLIITCPCALGLAVPAVQVVAAGELFRRNVLLNSGNAIERFAGIDTVVFDKTGTLTSPKPELVEGPYDPAALAVAARLALSSRHPMAVALACRAAGEPFADARETPGLGVSAMTGGSEARLGSPRFCKAEAEAATALAAAPDASSVICLRLGAGAPHVFIVRQALREDAIATVAELKRRGLSLFILSGDAPRAVQSVAQALGIDAWEASVAPEQKIARIEALRAARRKVLMVGDGVNDAPALAAATASLSPVTAAHVSQAAADALFLGERLDPVCAVLAVSRRAKRLMIQNLWISAIYNAFAIPLAAAGFLTPFIAALAMSGSSLAVTANALRARNGRAERQTASPALRKTPAFVRAA